jgi:hypothetical protein
LASSPATGRAGPAGELQELRQRLCEGNPELYRHLALYLQVLRQVLPVRVDRACFHLAAQVQPRRYPALPEEDRRLLHRRLNGLVRRCTSLLTVEQLASLAAQISRERQRQERRQRQQLIQHFSPSSDEEEDNRPFLPQREAAGPLPGSTVPTGPAPPRAERLPEGSVNLDGSLPFSPALLRILGDLVGRQPPLESPELPWSASAEAEEPDPPGGGDDEPAPAPGLPPLLQRLLAESEPPAEVREGGSADLWSGGQLPDDPLSLLHWLDGVEAALSRRLRNLSHAINVELLRVGLSGSLLPVSLLDAVLAGQLEPQPAPPNLLRLRLPFSPDDASPLQVMAVLLRSVDLELEEPRLRTCRRRLQQHRQEVRRMAQQFQRLQRRREAHEAEQLWLRDRHESLSPPD